MISINYETDFTLENKKFLSNFIKKFIESKGYKLGEINYIFCDDAYLLRLNIEFLNHDTFTDIISFDNTVGSLISGDIFISVERVSENATDFKVSFLDELYRVMIHGVLHFMGYKDKSLSEKEKMRNLENEFLLFIKN